MLELNTPVRFYLGANTPTGFVGYLDDLYDCNDGWRAYIIKSGPGTGKNTLMRTVLQQMTEWGEPAEAILCSSDPHSLDGVILPRLKLCLVDGTAPHIMEPKYWGAVEQIVDLGSCMDADVLHEQASAIIAATDACSAMHARCRKFIGAAASLLSDSARIVQEYTDAGKIGRTAARIAGREFGARRNEPGKERRRFLSAVTPEGILTFHETLQALCPRIYALEDEYGAAARLLMADLRIRALEAGLDIFTCACPLAPYDKLEHILIPSLGVAFTTSNSWHKADFPVYRRIHAARFLDGEALRAKRQILSFNRRAARELINEATLIASDAKAIHDRMEQFNIAAMDWERARRITQQVLARFAAIAAQEKQV